MRTLSILAAAILSVGVCSKASAAGMETHGGEPLSLANYADWPGIERVVNDGHRLYHTWVNGNEHFYYRGDTAALNAFLKRFAQEGAKREVVLRPAPAATKTFKGDPVEFDWMLHLVGGIAKHMTTLDKGKNVWPEHPVMHVYVGDAIKLDELVIPNEVPVVGLAELKARCREAMSSDNQNVRGWSNGALAELGAYDEESAAAIAKNLEDESEWVRTNAVLALAHFGTQANGILPALRKARDEAGPKLQKQIDETIAAVEQAETDEAAAEKHARTLRAIEEWLKKRGVP
ncbi:MAG: HEAT repeat domain-containing protein [Planctomycetaceae bacterium]